MCGSPPRGGEVIYVCFYFTTAKRFIVSIWPTAGERVQSGRRAAQCGQGEAQAEALAPGGEASGAPLQGCWAPGLLAQLEGGPLEENSAAQAATVSQALGIFLVSVTCSRRKSSSGSRGHQAHRPTGSGSALLSVWGGSGAVGLWGVTHSLTSSLVAAAPWKPRERWVRRPRVLVSRRWSPSGEPGSSWSRATRRKPKMLCGLLVGPEGRREDGSGDAPGGEVRGWWEAGRRGVSGSAPS